MNYGLFHVGPRDVEVLTPAQMLQIAKAIQKAAKQ